MWGHTIPLAAAANRRQLQGAHACPVAAGEGRAQCRGAVGVSAGRSPLQARGGSPHSVVGLPFPLSFGHDIASCRRWLLMRTWRLHRATQVTQGDPHTARLSTSPHLQGHFRRVFTSSGADDAEVFGDRDSSCHRGRLGPSGTFLTDRGGLRRASPAAPRQPGHLLRPACSRPVPWTSLPLAWHA